MNGDQLLILFILAATIATFLWGRWRHDMVAFGSLLACVLAGLVPASEAFSGFAHPAVITVACVLILSRGLQDSGAVDELARRVLPQSSGPLTMVAALTVLAAVLSGFMNNVGALALLMPVAIQAAERRGLPPGKVLMPVAFGSILGGMTTLIGTPPNLIVSGFRSAEVDGSFAMFDFTPVGLTVAAVGVLFVTLFGWRLVPDRERADAEGFETGAYLTEARVEEKAKADGMTLREIEKALGKSEALVVGLIRKEARIPAPNPYREVRAGDILVIEAEPETLASALSSLGLKLEEDVRPEPEKEEGNGENAEVEGPAETPPEDGKAGESDAKTPTRKSLQSGDVVLMELAVLPASEFAGRSASDIDLRSRFGINLLALSRQGHRSTTRLRTTAIREGDVLLMQGGPKDLGEFASSFGCVPLAQRPLRIPDGRRALLATAIMIAAITAAAFGLLPAAIAFSGGVLAYMLLRVVSPRIVYATIEWPVIVLLGALIPVAGAMADTGAADLLAGFLLNQVGRGHVVVALTLVLVVTMTLSDFMNNAATAAVMCPIAIGSAAQLGVSTDPFLMAVAVGASCAFLTPIGHQNSTLILGPGGFHFGDYWRLGLPLEMMVVAVGVPMILWVWPL
jgi:di/tricarboxylate transporter